MKKKTITSFIHSKNRTADDRVYNFAVDCLKVNGENKYIPYGNYSVKTFRTTILSLLPLETVIVYNDAQNTYTFTGTGTIQPITIGAVLGLPNNIQVPINNLTTGLINLSSFSKVILRTQGITYYHFNIENLQVSSSHLQLFSDIIFWKNKQDILPFQTISYNNEDDGNSF